MKLRVLVFAEEVGLRELLSAFLKQLGHEVQLYWGPSVCPLYQKPRDEHCLCPAESPCADVIVIDGDMPDSALDFLRFLHRRGCQTMDANRALMSANHSTTLAGPVAELGCYLISKPFRLDEIKVWLDACAERLAAHRSPG
ncbi:MAG: hypothetical protein FDZ69_12290 [Deltaproteobacteria bacterium]|nr:MAG: hypothetical protein FDZ69_12290 [Deltaproteobacteria bacterium]